MIKLMEHVREKKEREYEFMCNKSVSNISVAPEGYNPCMKLYLISEILQKNYIFLFRLSLHPFSPSPLIPLPAHEAN